MRGFFSKKAQGIIIGEDQKQSSIEAENAAAAANALGVEYEIEKVTDINEIMKFGVMMTPAFAIDGQVKIVGKVPSLPEIEKMIC